MVKNPFTLVLLERDVSMCQTTLQTLLWSELVKVESRDYTDLNMIIKSLLISKGKLGAS